MQDKIYPKPTKLFTKKRLYSTWRGSKDSQGKGGAPGVDRTSPISFAKSLERQLDSIVKQTRAGTFKFQPLRAIPIPKGDGKHRIICVPTVRDRLVQRAILYYLSGGEKDLLRVKHENSYGVAKGKEQGTHAAVDEAIRRRKDKPYVLKTDISKFFDNIPRKYLLDQLRLRLGNRSVVPFLEQVVNCEIREKNPSQVEKIKSSGIANGKGLRQGMPLSPLLSNLVLGKFDAMLAKRGKSFIRYVDDLVVFESTEGDCRETYTLVEKELAKISLSIPKLDAEASKSEIKMPCDEVVFLGLSIYQKSDGEYAKRIPTTAFSDLANRIEADVTFENFEGTDSRKSKNLREYIRWFDSMKKGYGAAYSGAPPPSAT